MQIPLMVPGQKPPHWPGTAWQLKHSPARQWLSENRGSREFFSWNNMMKTIDFPIKYGVFL